MANEAAGSILNDEELKKWNEAKAYFEEAVLFQENLWLQEGYEPKPMERRDYGKDILEYIESRVGGEKQVGELQQVEMPTDVMEDGVAQRETKSVPITQAFFDESEYAFPEIVEQRENIIANFANADFSQFKPITNTNEDFATFEHNVGVINLSLIHI